MTFASPEAAVKQLVLNNLKHTQNEIFEATLADLHSLTLKISGPTFNNTLEALMAFKQENQQWKLWTQANLAITND